MAQSAILSSAGTATIILNPVARTTSVTLVQTTTGSASSVIQVELTLDDPTTTPAPTMSWVLLSSAAAMTSSTSLSLLYTVTSPIGGVRLNSSALVASSASFTLKALQSVIA